MNFHARQPELLGTENIGRDFRDLASDCYKPTCRNDALELRNQYAIDARVVEDPNIPAAGVFLERIGYIVGRYLAQHFRWECLNSHLVVPQPHLKAREHKTIVQNRTQQESTSARKIYVCAVTVPILGQLASVELRECCYA